MDASLEPYDVAEPIVAYRCWNSSAASYSNPVWAEGEYTDRGLYSQAFNKAWRKDMVAAPCHHSGKFFSQGPKEMKKCDGPPCCGKREADGLRNMMINPGRIALGCGIYALSRLSQATMHCMRDGVVGKVLLHGDVWPHEDGYRASHARIVGLYDSRAFEESARWFHSQSMRFSGKALPSRLGDVPLWEIAKAYDVPIITPTEEEAKDLVYEGQAYFTAACLGYTYESLR